MSERSLSVPSYCWVLFALVGLTILNFGGSFLDVTGNWHLVLGLSIGLCKASLLVLFFMHALFIPRATWAVIAVACFWLVVVFATLTLTDYFSRGEIPFAPGH
jgi:caa(3)-type oxidase subunit IV